MNFLIFHFFSNFFVSCLSHFEKKRTFSNFFWKIWFKNFCVISCLSLKTHSSFSDVLWIPLGFRVLYYPASPYCLSSSSFIYPFRIFQSFHFWTPRWPSVRMLYLPFMHLPCFGYSFISLQRCSQLVGWFTDVWVCAKSHLLTMYHHPSTITTTSSTTARLLHPHNFLNVNYASFSVPKHELLIRPWRKVYGHLLPSISHLGNKLKQKT